MPGVKGGGIRIAGYELPILEIKAGFSFSCAGYYHKFEEGHSDHGYSGFIRLADLYNPDNGYLSANDSITLQAVIHTSKGILLLPKVVKILTFHNNSFEFY